MFGRPKRFIACGAPAICVGSSAGPLSLFLSWTRARFVLTRRQIKAEPKTISRR